MISYVLRFAFYVDVSYNCDALLYQRTSKPISCLEKLASVGVFCCQASTAHLTWDQVLDQRDDRPTKLYRSRVKCYLCCLKEECEYYDVSSLRIMANLVNCIKYSPHRISNSLSIRARANTNKAINSRMVLPIIR